MRKLKQVHVCNDRLALVKPPGLSQDSWLRRPMPNALSGLQTDKEVAKGNTRAIRSA